MFAGLIQWLRLLAIVPRCESVENANLGTNKGLDLLNIETCFRGSRYFIILLTITCQGSNHLYLSLTLQVVKCSVEQ